jgi:DNA-binding CsgD family transcriptional regulator
VATATTGLGRTSVVGRESEVATLEAFLRRGDAPRALVFAGGAGIGKTTLWETGVALAKVQGFRVLSARPTDAEAQFSFGALVDLLDGVDTNDLKNLPAPQRRALDVALLRAESAEEQPEPQAIAVGLLNTLRALAARGPVLVAVDDVQWLDPSSAAALTFAARRLGDEAVVFLLSMRSRHPSGLVRALESRLDELEVGPLSLGAMRRLLSERHGLSLSRHRLRRLVEATLGNPLFALEVGRTLAEQGAAATGEELPVPDAVEDLLGVRVSRLPAPQRRLLLAIALSADLRASQLAALADSTAVDDAVDAGVLVVDGERVRASHPLLAAAARKHSHLSARRQLHLELADVVVDDELRARHLAFATEGVDAELAATVAAAATAASFRGARREAVELAEHALRLTPPEAAEYSERLVELAEHVAHVGGEAQRVNDLLAGKLDSLPPGELRVRAWVILIGGVLTNDDEVEHYLERALAESDDPALGMTVLAEFAGNEAVTRVRRIREVESWMEGALPAARSAGPEVERNALYTLAWARSLRGRPIDDLRAGFQAASSAAATVTSSPERVAGQRHVWRGELEQARAVLAPELARADDQGEAGSYALMRLHLCELELRAGDWEAAGRLLDEWGEPSERELLTWPMYERCRALHAAGLGLPEEAAHLASHAIERSEASGVGWDLLESLRARGITALLAHEPERGAESLRAVWGHTWREGVDEPGVFPVAPELVEALVELGELEEAAVVTARLRQLSEEQQHPWGLASAERCTALIELRAPGGHDAAARKLADAADAYGKLGLRFDRARSLRSLGRAERRLKKWAAARRSLGQAAEAFDEQGSTGWAEEVRAELERVGGRRPQRDSELTPAERRVVELAANGATNKEIAQELFVSVHTVETHLTHAYAKLGVRSRGQLASRLAS